MMNVMKMSKHGHGTPEMNVGHVAVRVALEIMCVCVSVCCVVCHLFAVTF